MSTLPTSLDRVRARLATLSAGAIVTLLLFVVYAVRYLTVAVTYVDGDGAYSWIFARSMAFDGDLHLANDYALCGDPWHKGTEEGGGRPVNPFYFGPALVWAPLLRIARAVISLPAGSPAAHTAGCEGPLARFALSPAPLFAALTLWIGYRIARRWVGDRPAAAGVAVMGLCSTLTHFASINPTYSHVWSAFCVGLATLTWLRATERPESLARWALAGASVGLAFLMRMQSAVLLFAPALSLAREIYLARARPRDAARFVLAGAVTLAGFFAVASVQFALNKLLYGSLFVIPYGRSYLHLRHGNPFFLLFSSFHGLFTWTPLLYLGVFGLVLMLARPAQRFVAFALLVPIAIDVYVNSSAVWHSGASFGARRLTTLAAPFVATTAVFLSAAWRWVRASERRLVLFASVGWLFPWAYVNLGATTGVTRGGIAYGRTVRAPEYFGQSVLVATDGVYRGVGNPFSLPAGLPFAARYRVHPARFDDVSSGGMFEHDYRPVRLTGPDTFSFSSRDAEALVVDGFESAPGGALVRPGRRTRLLLELAWGYVTHVVIDASPAQREPAALEVTARGVLGFASRFTVRLPANGGSVETAVPAGAFDSGVNEIEFTADRPVVLRSWRWVDRSYHDTSVH